MRHHHRRRLDHRCVLGLNASEEKQIKQTDQATKKNQDEVTEGGSHGSLLVAVFVSVDFVFANATSSATSASDSLPLGNEITNAPALFKVCNWVMLSS